jgi:hypothetical protein
MNQLDALKQFTTVVADTGDFKQLSVFHADRRYHQAQPHFESGAKARLRAFDRANRASPARQGAGRDH